MRKISSHNVEMDKSYGSLHSSVGSKPEKKKLKERRKNILFPCYAYIVSKGLTKYLLLPMAQILLSPV